MFWKVTISQVNHLLRKKEAMSVFSILFFMVIYNFWNNALAFQGRDVAEMYHPMKLMLLSYNRTNYNADLTLLLIQIYPFLVICPAGFSLVKEEQLGEYIYLSSRVGCNTYRNSKFMAVFLTTAIVFILPLLLEFILYCISFPVNAIGDLTNWSCYDSDYLQWVKNYFMSGLYNRNVYLYTLFGILLFGIVAGMLATAVVILFSFFKVKYNVFLFLPAFILLNLSVILTTEESDFSYRWYDYLLLFNEREKNTMFFFVAVLVLILLVLGGLLISSRKDHI